MIEHVLRSRLEGFLAEDAPWGDATCRYLFPSALGPIPAEGTMVVRHDSFVAGLAEAKLLFALGGCPAQAQVEDGSFVTAGSEVLRAQGDARALLGVERVAINLLAHMSGVCSVTAQTVAACRKVNPRVRVAATRKTLPGLRWFEKRAVELGGGDMHRMDLSQAILVKDNHLALLKDPRAAIDRLRRVAGFTLFIEVEADDEATAVAAAEAGANAVLLDNMDPATFADVARKVKERAPGVIVEASGGIRPENAPAYAEHADVISIGSLTLSAPSVDFSFEVLPIRR